MFSIRVYSKLNSYSLPSPRWIPSCFFSWWIFFLSFFSRHSYIPFAQRTRSLYKSQKTRFFFVAKAEKIGSKKKKKKKCWSTQRIKHFKLYALFMKKNAFLWKKQVVRQLQRKVEFGEQAYSSGSVEHVDMLKLRSVRAWNKTTQMCSQPQMPLQTPKKKCIDFLEIGFRRIVFSVFALFSTLMFT